MLGPPVLGAPVLGPQASSPAPDPLMSLTLNQQARTPALPAFTLLFTTCVNDA